jgi:uncharacterized protein (TIGR00304 family)
MIFLGSLKGGESKVEGGGVIIIGPIPIVIGTSERISKMLIVLAIVLTVVSVIVFFLMSKIILLPR